MDKVVAHVYESYDYDKFHIMDKGNRDIRLRDKSAELINEYCKKPCELDKARQAKKLSKKLKKKIYNGKE